MAAGIARELSKYQVTVHQPEKSSLKFLKAPGFSVFSPTNSSWGGLEQWSPNLTDHAPVSVKSFEHAPPAVFPYKLNICTSILVHCVHDKTYTKIELKKGWDKNEIHSILKIIL